MKYFLIALLIILILCLLLTGVAAIIIGYAGFNKRCEGNENLKYLKAKNFDNLNARPISFISNKGQTLRGFLYSGAKTDKYKALIIFSHGMGAGHLSYTTEINYFAQKGFLVLAYDNTGTCESDGKKLYGAAQGIIDLKHAVKFAESREELKELPMLLLGHSWGGYSVCNVSAIGEFKSIKGIAAFSPFNSFAHVINDTAKQRTKISLRFLIPFINIVNFLKFGKTGLLTSCDTIASNKTPTLIMHGGNDMAVSVSNSPVGLKNRIEANPNAQTVLYESKFHNVYLAKEAEQYLNNTFAKIASLKENSPEAYEVYQAIDYSLITKEDLTVMETVLEFFEECTMTRDFLCDGKSIDTDTEL